MRPNQMCWPTWVSPPRAPSIYFRLVRFLSAGRLVETPRRGRLVEITVGELVHHQREVLLWPRSSDPDHQQPIALPSRHTRPPAKGGNLSVAVAGIVLASWQPEEAVRTK